MNKQLSLAVTLCAVTSVFTTAQAQVACGDTITTSEVLTEDLFCGSSVPAALTIQGPGGRLDMRRFALSCEGSGAIGIQLLGTGAVLQNGFVTDCGDGVVLDGSNHRVLNEMIVENSNIDGVRILAGSGHQVRETISRNNGDDGFQDVNAGSSNTFERNQATGNDDDGFSIFVDNNTFTRNVVTNNEDGFVIRGENHLLSQNVAQNNDADGFELAGSNNRLTRNSARNNLDDGFDVFSGALNNTLTDNRGSGNGSADADGDGGFDLEDDNENCDNNTWTKNRGTRNQPTCIQ